MFVLSQLVLQLLSLTDRLSFRELVSLSRLVSVRARPQELSDLEKTKTVVFVF